MKTPLCETHKKLGARFIAFGGWEMPLQYEGILSEVRSVRESAGIFDVSHMGRLRLRGKGVREKLQVLTTNDVNKLKPGKVQYNLLTNEKGGIKDDITVYMLSEEEFMLCVNAANREKVLRWLGEHMDVEDMTLRTVQIALQGKESEYVLGKLYDVAGIKYYRFKTFGEVLISRTGYTGEDGFEIYAPVEEGVKIFKKLVGAVRPCGLGSRDVLRIEAGLPLYGHEISEDITPLEANLGRFVDFSKNFLGKEALLGEEVKRKLFGLELEDKGVPRKGQEILKGGSVIGKVSSGTFSPTLGKGIALCFVEVEERREGAEVRLRSGRRELMGRLRAYPFVGRRK